MRVRFSPRAQRRTKLVSTWWRTHRPAAPTLFDEELAEAIVKLAEQPQIGSVYERVATENVRRLLLPRSGQHVYYAVDTSADVIVIHTIWGARRKRGPSL